MLRKIYVVAALIFIAVTAFVFRSWLEAHDDRLQLQATLATQKQLIAAADAHEQQRASELKGTLDQINALKRQTQTPQEIVRELPQYLPLPQPIEIVASDTAQKGTPVQASGNQGSPLSKNSATQPPEGVAASGSGQGKPIAQLPVEDLKPLFDFVQDCRACQARLASAQADLRDEQTKSAAIVQERDAAIKAAKGGSFWTRIKRNAKWFAIGAGLGAAAARAAH
jgi:hypothetical protein